jgi:SAM-dependent methyltransferase
VIDRQSEGYDLGTARQYWRFAPSGKGKIDTSELLALDDARFYAEWNEHFKSRLDHYWEDRRIVPHFARLFAGKSVLSFGSGIGHNEILFMRRGARVTCADIVQSNLDTIARVCRHEGLTAGGFLLLDEAGTTDFGGPYDHVFARGSLMTMPFEQQQRVMAKLKQALRPGGMIILNLYTWEFVKQTCNVDTPTVFARHSDPSVGGVHNPWSDWHDDAKLQDLAGPDMVISHRQFWNQGLYVWYGLSWRSQAHGPAQPFVDLDAAAPAAARRAVPLDDFTLAEAERIGTGLHLRTGANNFLYAAVSGLHARESLPAGPLELMVDADLRDGAFSVGILDEDAQAFVLSRAITWKGRHRHFYALPEAPPRFRIVLSNHREKTPARSEFVVHDIAFVAAPAAADART